MNQYEHDKVINIFMRTYHSIIDYYEKDRCHCCGRKFHLELLKLLFKPFLPWVVWFQERKSSFPPFLSHSFLIMIRFKLDHPLLPNDHYYHHLHLHRPVPSWSITCSARSDSTIPSSQWSGGEDDRRLPGDLQRNTSSRTMMMILVRWLWFDWFQEKIGRCLWCGRLLNSNGEKENSKNLTWRLLQSSNCSVTLFSEEGLICW